MNRVLLTVTSWILSWSLLFADSHKIDSLSSVLPQVKDTSKVNVLLELAAEYEYVDRGKAMQYTKQASELAKAVNFKKGEIRSQYELAILSFLNGNRASALPFLEIGLEMSQQINNDLLIALGYFHMSHYYEEEGDYSSALDYVNKALYIYKNLNNQLRISQCYSAFGGIYKALGQFENALIYYFDALPLKEAINDQRGISIVLSNIGGVYLLTSKLEEAREYFYKCLAIDRTNDDQEGIVYTLTRIGVANQKMGEFDAAIAYYDTALVMAQELNFRIDESILLGNIGSTLRSLDNYEESLNYLFSALKIKKELQRKGSAAHTCNDICETYLKLGNPLEAKKYALQAIELATHVDVNQQRVGLYLLADCEYELLDYKNAYDHLVQSNVITDSMFTNESESRMNELEVKYQSDKKEQEIENLKVINESARFRNVSYAGAAISFLILGGLLYYLQRIRIRRNRLLLEKEKELDRMKSRFFANISHEFRTPLTLILSPLDDLIHKIEQTNIKKQLQVMKRNAGRLLELVNQLLDLSKIESGKLSVNLSSSDIISVIKGVSMSFHSIAEQKNIRLELDVLPNQLIINYDRQKIETILTNLLSNAFKYTPENGIITVQTKVISRNGILKNKEVIQIAVVDNGEGIPEEDIGQIFDRFYQSDNSQLLQQEGSGIGLALTKELVELHNGNISAISTIGEGTQIKFQLPVDLLPQNSQHIDAISNSENASKFHEVPEIELEREEHVDSQLPVILLIEDHKDVRNYVQEILNDTYCVNIAEDGEKGISTALELMPELILSDVMMPKKDGYEVCEALKNDPRTSHIPIILLTAKSDSEDKITGLMTKADDYITKPFILRELLLRIENLIESRKLLREKYKNEGILKPKEIATNSIDEIFLKKLVELVEENMSDENFGVEQLGDEIGMSRSQLHRKLKALLDQSPNQFIRSFRLHRAHDLLKQQSATASEIAYQVGFSSPSYFTKCFHEQFGYTPSDLPI